MAGQVYRVGRRGRRRHWRRGVAVFLLLTASVGYLVYRQISSDVQPVIANPKQAVRTVVAERPEVQRFDFASFRFNLPPDWKQVNTTNSASHKFSFQSTQKNADNRYLDVYVDQLPTTMALNKAVAVRAEGAKLSHGLASDNCTNFTTAPASGSTVLSFPAKWDGVDFICDNDNITRNVLGTSSPGAVNQVVLTGPSTGRHAFFFVYTDNNYSPEYAIFYGMLDSFQAK